MRRSPFVRVATAVALAALPIGAAPAAIPAKPGTVHVLWEKSLPSEENGDRQVAVIGSRVFADSGNVLEALDLDRGTVRWQRRGVQIFRVGGQNVFAGLAGSVVALTVDGHVLWKRPACVGGEIALDLTTADAKIFALCGPSRGGPGNFAALSAQSGSLLYRSSLNVDANPAGIEVVGPSLFVRTTFAGAYSGEYQEFFNPATGRLIAKFTNHDIVTVRGNRVLLNDGDHFDVGNAYEPALLSWLDLTTGAETKHVALSPPESYQILNGHPKYNFGATFVAGDWLYLKLGPMLYRYRLPDFRRREIVMADAGQLLYYGSDAAVLSISGNPKNRLVELFLGDTKIVTRPLAELEGPLDLQGDGLATNDSLFAPNDDGKSYLVDANDGRVYNGEAGNADVRIGARRALALAGAGLELYELRNP